MFRIGQGFDVHRFAEDRSLIIGGIKIPYEMGLIGHSDADVLLHALTDALLGAAGFPDIGTLFPDTDPAHKNADSALLLRNSWQRIKEEGYQLINADCTIMAQKPKLSPYRDAIRKRIANILDVEMEQINIKASTTERLGFVGRKEGIAAMAVALLQKEKF